MTKDEYEQWKHHPLTEKFHQFLRDYRQQLMERWAMGEFSLPGADAYLTRNTEMVARAQCLRDIAEMDAGAISQFYSSGGSDEASHN